MAEATPVERIAARMMMGAASGRGPNATTEQIAAFVERHRELIEKARDAVPKNMTAFAAAVAKCALKSIMTKAIEFANRVREKSFVGKNDLCTFIIAGFIAWNVVGKTNSDHKVKIII